MTNAELELFKDQILNAITEQTHESIKETGHTWIKDAVREIVPVVFEDTLLRLGINSKEPIELQKDLAHLRQSRLDSYDTFKMIKRMVIGWITPIIISCFLLYEKFIK